MYNMNSMKHKQVDVLRIHCSILTQIMTPLLKGQGEYNWMKPGQTMQLHHMATRRRPWRVTRVLIEGNWPIASEV